MSTVDRLWVYEVNSRRHWRGRLAYLRVALRALLHPRPTYRLKTPGANGPMIEVKAATMADAFDLFVAGTRHAVIGETTMVLNHGVWVPGAIAVKVDDDPRGEYHVTLPAPLS